jgi:RimJ/RimL family protein N-acetyltransferase
MSAAEHRLETDRLVIRAFVPEDWPGIQALAIDINSSDAGKYDCMWPTSDEDSRGMAGYFGGREGLSWAVCLKADGRLIGCIAYNSFDPDRRVDLGHVFHTAYQRDDLDTEALACMIDYAFANHDVDAVYSNNVEAWAVQVAPLEKLGAKLMPSGQGERGGFPSGQRQITRGEWLRRKGALGSR